MVWGVPETWQQRYSLSMNSGKIVAGRVDGTEIEGSTRGPRGPKNSKFGGLWWWPGWWKWSKTRDHLHWARRPGQPPLILNFTPNFSWSCAPQFNKLTWLTSLIWDPDNFPPFDERPREACRKKLCTWMGFAKKTACPIDLSTTQDLF